MTTCDNDHEPITFAGEFRLLCPLCALKREMAEALTAAEEQAREAQEVHDDQIDALERKLEKQKDLTIKAEQEAEAWESRAKELEKKLEEK